jgi:hypothetical protein
LTYIVKNKILVLKLLYNKNIYIPHEFH